MPQSTNAMRPACAQHPSKIEVRRAKAVGPNQDTTKQVLGSRGY